MANSKNTLQLTGMSASSDTSDGNFWADVRLSADSASGDHHVDLEGATSMSVDVIAAAPTTVSIAAIPQSSLHGWANPTKAVRAEPSDFTLQPDGSYKATITIATKDSPNFQAIAADAADHSVKPDSAAAGDTVNVAAAPADGYRLKAGSLAYTCGDKTVPITGTSFTMPDANVTVSAQFEKIPHAISVSPTNNGTVSVDPKGAAAGDTVNVAVTPAKGYRLKPGSLAYTYGGRTVPITGTSFTMPDADVTVSAQFETVTAPGENPKTGSGDPAPIAAAAVATLLAAVFFLLSRRRPQSAAEPREKR